MSGLAVSFEELHRGKVHIGRGTIVHVQACAPMLTGWRAHYSVSSHAASAAHNPTTATISHPRALLPPPPHKTASAASPPAATAAASTASESSAHAGAQ